MPIASMTGFARVTGLHGDASFAWELKSVNARGLDLRLRVPPGLDGLEVLTREALAKKITRGTIHASLTVDRPPRPIEIRVNQEVLGALLKTAEAVRAQAGDSVRPASVDGLLAVRGAVEIIEQPDSEEARQALFAAVQQVFLEAVDALAAARADEGRAIGAVVSEQIDQVAALIAEADHIAAVLPHSLWARIKDQVEALVENTANFDIERLHQEAALLAVRADVREELDRLKAHVGHARELIANGGVVGRKFDFLAQEFNREANTLCSKSSNKDLTRLGLSLKTVIDQLREQVQNIE